MIERSLSVLQNETNSTRYFSLTEDSRYATYPEFICQSCSLPIVCTNDITKDETIKKFFVCYDTPFDPLADFSGKHFVIVGSINFHTSASSECPLICTLTRLCKTVASISK